MTFVMVEVINIKTKKNKEKIKEKFKKLVLKKEILNLHFFDLVEEFLVDSHEQNQTHKSAYLQKF